MIGVPIRGTEQRTKKVFGHPIPATPQEILDEVNKCSVVWGKEIDDRKIGLFIKAEEEEAIEYVTERFENVFYTDARRIKNYHSNIAASNIDFSENSEYKSLLEYITQIYLISKCDAIIGSFNNGLYCSYLWSYGKDIKFDLIDKGRYE